MEFHNDYDSSLDSKYYLSGRRIGSPTSPFTAKQLEEFGKRMNEGIQNVEIGTLKPDVFETIPEEHFKEIRRLSKITNTGVSMHAPLVEPSGFGEQTWSPQQRVANESQISNVLERAGLLGENTHVVLHGANVFGQQWEKGLKAAEEGKEGMRAMRIVNQEEGKMIDLPYEEKRKILSKKELEYYREKGVIEKGKKEMVWDPRTRLRTMNNSQWDEGKLKLFEFQKQLDELEEKRNKKTTENYLLERSEAEKEKQRINRNNMDINVLNQHIDEIKRHFDSNFDDMVNKVEKFSSSEVKEKNIEEIKKLEDTYDKVQNELYKLNGENIKLQKRKDLTGKDIEIFKKNMQRIYELEEKRTKEMINSLDKIKAPEVWKPVKDFAIDQASDTIAGSALHAYKKFGEKAPVLAIENSYPEMPLSRADELKKGIELARKKFTEKLAKEKKLPIDKAKKIAEKLIGATWDIGHINMLRKAGYSEEELKKKLIEETKTIGPLVKHVHITDNFGFNDTHLPPGMGNVPIKQILEELEKQGWKGPGIIEAGNFVKEFEVSPFPQTLEYFESPMPTGYGFKQDIVGGYLIPHVEFPPQSFDLYGSKFSTLPTELGGQVGGERGRFAQGGEKESY